MNNKKKRKFITNYDNSFTKIPEKKIKLTFNLKKKNIQIEKQIDDIIENIEKLHIE